MPRPAPVIALDANGADLGPAEVARGAAEAARRGVEVIVFGSAAALGSDLPETVQVVDAPVSIAKAPDPARPTKTSRGVAPTPPAMALWEPGTKGGSRAR